ncbi:hypothetical protein KDH_57490 [Dictyobacter sp. S3.2.2.5]|uniref:Uncharacterized protein n=1 Tax=Dictyobacter halimunensis TaxID=3026934 RepID=A0ABQ6FYV1_9CHLR|nr:hypothetical protein KDH_57490 [Dictyobacter sp. S3.2.2.5]
MEKPAWRTGHLDEDDPCMYNHACIAMSFLKGVRGEGGSGTSKKGLPSNENHKCNIQEIQ